MSKLHEAILSYEREDFEERIREREARHRSLFHPIYNTVKSLRVDWLVENFLPQGYLVHARRTSKSGKPASPPPSR